MRKSVRLFTLVTLSVLVALSCATASREITAKSQSVRTDMFTEMHNGGPPAQGFVDLTIRTSIKTHLEGRHVLKWVEDVHGKPGYPFLFNIDGQAVTWKIQGQPDITPSPHGETERPPEGGPGVKYVLEKRVRLPAGSHVVFFALPGENYSTEFELGLEEKKVHLLELEPVYGKPGRGIFPNFLYGIEGYEIFLDGNRVPQEKATN